MSCARILAATKGHDLTATAKLLFITLASWVNDDGLCQATLKALSESIEASIQGTRTAIAALVRAGLLTVEAGAVGHKASTYRVAVEVQKVTPKVHSRMSKSDTLAPPRVSRIAPPEPPRVSESDSVSKSDTVKNCTHESQNSATSARALVDSLFLIKEEWESDSIRQSQNLLHQARSKRTRPAQIPSDWTPNEAERKRALELGVDPDRATEEFVAYWQGAGKAKADWQATFRNRVIALADLGRCKIITQPARSNIVPLASHL